jgi:hypothetical protein
MIVTDSFSLVEAFPKGTFPSHQLIIKGYSGTVQAHFKNQQIDVDDTVEISKLSEFAITDLKYDIYLSLVGDVNDEYNVQSFCPSRFIKLGCNHWVEYYCDLDDILAYTQIKHAPQVYLNAIKETIKYSKQKNIKYRDLKSNEPGMVLEILTSKQKTIYDCVSVAHECVQSIITQAQFRLNPFFWNPIYEQDERKFSREVVLPLLQKMEFKSINYRHGKKEYGKDFTFMELSKFGQPKYYGMQVKAGNISGKVNSGIDIIIGQIEDAFAMPFYEINSLQAQYISTLIVITSQYYTENAKEKIMHKVDKRLHGNIYFIDRGKVQELILEYFRN